MTELIHQEKYLKYKQKYLDLKNQEGGVKSLLYSAFVTILNNYFIFRSIQYASFQIFV